MWCCFNDVEKQRYRKNALDSRDINQPHRTYIPWVWRRKVQDAYHFGRVLGQGAFAIVHEAMSLDPPHEPYAIKVISRHRLTDPTDLRHFHDEVQILLDLQHDHIISLHELYKTADYFFVVMEKLDGGELFDRLCQRNVLSEKETRDIMKNVLQAVAYCHENHVAHRDLKPENLLLTTPHEDAKVKIADFGFAKRVARNNSLSTRCGSPAYMASSDFLPRGDGICINISAHSHSSFVLQAPELVNYQMYDERVDNWSLGVVVYTILGGFNPFVRDTLHLTLQQIRQSNYNFKEPTWDGISRDAKRFIKALMNSDPVNRLTADEALMHPWMTGRGDDLMQNTVDLDKLREYNDEQKTKTKVKSHSVYWLVARR